MACTLCEGTGWKAVEQDGVRRMQRCDCWREDLVRRRLGEAGIPKQYEHCDLSNFIIYPNEKLQRAVAGVRKFADRFPVVDKGLFLIGPPGVGKSHLAAAALKEAILRCGARGLFYPVPELLKLIRSTYNRENRTAEMDVLRPVLQADLLVLDDIGAEKTSEWVGETLNLVVNTRYNERRPTIFTSNFEDEPPESVEARANDEMRRNETLVERVGYRIYSRLHEMCDFLEFEGVDYRRFAPPNATADDLTNLWQQKKISRRRSLPPRSLGQARVHARDGKADLGWPGGKAGSHT